MQKFRLGPIRAIADELAAAAEAFPNFHYVEFSGTGVDADAALLPLLTAFTGGADYELQQRTGRVYCLYGLDLGGGIATLRHMTDRIALGIRLAAEQFPGAGPDDTLPVLRGDRAPFVLVGAVLRMMESYPQELKRSLEPYGVEIDILPGAPRVVAGVPVADADGASVTFPGEVIVHRTRGRGWAAVKAAVARGDLSVMHTLTPVFSLVHALFETNLSLLRFLRKISADDGDACAPAPVSSPSAGAAPKGGAAPGGDDVRVDRATLTAMFDGRTCTAGDLGPLQFSLLERINRRPGTPVYYNTLRELGDVWDGSPVEDESIRSSVKRLRDALRASGMRRLADRIRTGTLNRRDSYVVLHAEPVPPKKQRK